MYNKKMVSILLLIAGIGFILCGFGLSLISNEFNKSTTSDITVNKVDGQIVIDATGAFSGHEKNPEMAKKFKTYSNIAYYVAIVSITGAIVIGQKAKKEVGLPIERKKGIVIEKRDRTHIIVQFEDGTRQIFFSDENLILVEGDSGWISFRGQMIIEFEKELQ